MNLGNMDLGPHAATIWMCYGAVGFVIAGLIARLMADGRRLSRQLASLEERGIRRRSASGSASAAEPAPNVGA